MADETIFSSELKTGHTEKAAETNFLEFKKVVDSRRSVRVYDGSSVSEEDIRACLELALLSPNSSNLQPWEFYWAKSEAKKKALVEACLSQPAASTAEEIIVCVARTDTWKKHASMMLDTFQSAKSPPPKAAQDYYRKLVPLAYNQGPLGIFGWVKRVLFFFRGLSQPTPREPISENQMALWATKSAALACQTLMLSLRAKGLDSCPMEGLDSKRVKRILGLRRGAYVVMAISAGRRAPSGVYGSRIRFDSSHFLKEI